MKISLFGAIFSAILLASCATTYHKQGLSGGFSETQLGENIFQISFKGNAYTSRERASDFTLLRSAEVTVENGFRYFIIVDSEQYSKTGAYTTPTTYNTIGNASVYGNNIYGSATTTTSGGHTYIYSKPRTTNTIVCFREKPEAHGLVYDASFLVASIRAKYGLVERVGGDAGPAALSSDKTRQVENQAPNDVKGWHDAIWGMSLSELRRLYQSNFKESCKEGGGGCTYTLEQATLRDKPFSVEFYLDKQSGLSQVVLTNTEAANNLDVAKRIEAELLEQLGTPTDVKGEYGHIEPTLASDGRTIPGVNGVRLRWDFPSTIVTYTRSITKYSTTDVGGTHSVILLDYKAN